MQQQYTILTEPGPAGHSIRLMLNGKFSEDALPELEQSISNARHAHQQIYIDLSEVTLVDRKTVEYISDQADQNVKLVNCPIYLRHWIRQASGENDV